jgi:hyperosmotically inducible protein
MKQARSWSKEGRASRTCNSKEDISMCIQRSFLTIAFSAALMAVTVPVKAQAPDNTATNKRDRDAGEATADRQKENRGDRELTRNIRRSIMADKSLSSYAHNVKIISQNGTVTLKGPVKSEAEKSSVVAKAVAVVGSADKVTDQVSVKH